MEVVAAGVDCAASPEGAAFLARDRLGAGRVELVGVDCVSAGVWVAGTTWSLRAEYLRVEIRKSATSRYFE